MLLSFSAAALQKTVNILNQNKRDILNDELSPYYAVDQSAQNNIDTRYEEVRVFRAANELEEISEASFVASSTLGGGQSFFEKVLLASGIEASFEEDLTEQAALIQAPPSVSSFIVKEARKFDINTSNLENVLKFSNRPATKHLVEDDARFIGDSDKIVFDRLKQSQQYIRDLIK